MGNCNTCESTSVATAKVILQNGRLQEFSYQVKVWYVLQKNPSCFICNSDSMDFDDVLSPLKDDEVLHPGQLYFALPLTFLKNPLQAEEMAALAVKASAALMKSGGEKCGCHRKSFCPVVVSSEVGQSKKVTDASCGDRRSGGRKRRSFEARLDVITE